MKKNRIIIPALGLIALGTAASITGTVAWFTANSRVTATNITVKAISDTTYLLISQTNSTASAIQTENVTTQDLSINEDILPCAPVTKDEEVALLTVADGHNTTAGTAISTASTKVTTPATAADFKNWYTANAAANNAATWNTSSVKQLASFTDYVIVDQLYLTVAAGANPANNLTVTPTFAQVSTGNDLTAGRVLVTTSDGGFAILSSANNGTPVDIKGSNTNLTDSTVLTVNLYIYVDGNAAPIYTNNSTNILGVTCGLQFDVSVA